MWRAMVADAYKLPRTWILPLVLLGPSGVIALVAVRYAIEYDRLWNVSKDHWGLLIRSVNSVALPTLILGITILSSLLAGMEHRGRMWKQVCALPVRRLWLYVSKFAWLALLLTFAAFLCAMGTVLLGMALGFGTHIPWSSLLQMGFAPYLAAYALLALQLLLSILVANQAYAILAGVISVILVLSSQLLPHWLPWTYPFFASPAASSNPLGFMAAGIALGLFGLMLGIVMFLGREYH
jgi:hypothetical protein